jgi:hypothetical protein
VIKPKHVEDCEYVVLCRSGKSKEFEGGDEPKGSAFVVGRGLAVVPSPHMPERYMIKFREYALCAIPDVWPGDRYPVRYLTMEELGIDPAGLEFKPMPGRETIALPAVTASPTETEGKNPVEQASAILAAALGVHPSQIEIRIRL